MTSMQPPRSAVAPQRTHFWEGKIIVNLNLGETIEHYVTCIFWKLRSSSGKQSDTHPADSGALLGLLPLPREPLVRKVTSLFLPFSPQQEESEVGRQGALERGCHCPALVIMS